MGTVLMYVDGLLLRVLEANVARRRGRGDTHPGQCSSRKLRGAESSF